MSLSVGRCLINWRAPAFSLAEYHSFKPRRVGVLGRGHIVVGLLGIRFRWPEGSTDTDHSTFPDADAASHALAGISYRVGDSAYDDMSIWMGNLPHRLTPSQILRLEERSGP